MTIMMVRKTLSPREMPKKGRANEVASLLKKPLGEAVSMAKRMACAIDL